MIKIDRYGPRLECFLFKRKFDERVADLEPVSFLAQSLSYFLWLKANKNLSSLMAN